MQMSNTNSIHLYAGLYTAMNEGIFTDSGSVLITSLSITLSRFIQLFYLHEPHVGILLL